MKKYVQSTAIMFGAFGLLGTLSGCQTAAQKEAYKERAVAYKSDVRLGDPVDKICFAQGIRSFSDNTHNTVVLTRSANKNYLVVTRGCPRLKRAQTIGMDSNTACLRRNDALVVSEDAFTLNDKVGGPSRCLIEAIHQWNKDVEVDESTKDKT